MTAALLAALAIAAISPAGARAQAADSIAPLPVTVTGRLVELRTEIAVGDALLRLEPVNGVSSEVRTEETGRFTFSPVPPGSYTLRVEHLGYQSLAHALDLGRGMETDLQIQLVPEALQLGQWVGLLVLALVGWLMYRTGTKGNALGAAEAGPR